jgi:multidrug efflux pump subunit AcrB
MNLPALAIEKKPITYFAIFLLVAGGIFSYFQLGQLEDPEFTVKAAAIITTYPGASAEQVELEVTDRIETKLQEMQEVKNIYSNSRAGLSIVKVDIKNEYWSDRLPQVWDIMRKKIRDMEGTLPPGAGKPQINDDFGFVFGFLLAVTGDGYTYAQLEEYVKNIRKELSLVEGVARVALWGVQKQRIYIDTSEAQLSQLGLTTEALVRTLQVQNMVADAGRVDFQTKRFRIAPTGEFQSPEEIGNLAVIASLPNRGKLMGSVPSRGDSSSEIIRIKDFATVSRGYIEPPENLMRYNEMPAIGVALAPLSGVNAVKIGQAVDQRIDELMGSLPVGVGLHRISWQSDLVADSIKDFMINLIEAVAIVLVVLALTMGLRVGMIIGITGLILPILGTFIVMSIGGIDLQRVSLGALIIAMGMMVDNAIVVADGIMVRVQQGTDRKKAAIEAASKAAMPLLGATVVACMAFYPIFASIYDTGEYAGSLFTVVAISLLLSWVMSQTVAPLMCMTMLPEPKQGVEDQDIYGGRFYEMFRGLLAKVIRFRLPFLAGMVVLLVAAVLGFRFVPKMYFPDSSRQQIMIDYWVPEGTRIQQVSAALSAMESELLQKSSVTAVSAFIGKGPPRFYLPVNPEDPYSSYAQIIVNTKTFKDVDTVMQEIDSWSRKNYPQALVRVRRYAVGAFDDWKIEARFSGPANADPDVLRSLAQKGMAILEANPMAREVRTNWRNRIRRIVPQYNQERGRWAGVTRENLASATKRAFDGVVVGQYREEDDLIPIVVRNVKDERRRAAAGMDLVQIIPAFSNNTVPLSQVTDDIVFEWEDPIIWRWDRRRAITVQCSPNVVTTPALRSSIVEAFENIELPPGYSLEWDGEYNSAKQSQQALIPGMVPAVVIMLFIIVILFNAYRPPLIIFLTIPFVVIGITVGLMITGVPFGFIALLGAMSLSGMMIKNAVVLLDQVNLNLAEGMSPYQAVVEAAVSRLRPVVNAAATTVFGMAPLLQDVFWLSLAVTIMFGLAFGTILTMIVVPVLYATLFRIPAMKK